MEDMENLSKEDIEKMKEKLKTVEEVENWKKMEWLNSIARCFFNVQLQ
jgi:hypothetical protein